MLVRFNKNRRVEWINFFITAAEAASYLNEHTLWAKNGTQPVAEQREGYRPYLVLSQNNELFYEYEAIALEDNYGN